MSRPVKLYPGSDPNIFDMPFWCDIHQDQNSTELWVDFHITGFETIVKIGTPNKTFKQPLDWSIVDAAERIVIYDWYLGLQEIQDIELDWVRELNEHKPVTWITLNPLPVPGINTIHFDYYWNRSKRVFHDRQLYHKLYGVENFVQYPLHDQLRPQKFLTYHSRKEPYREIVRQHLIQNYNGFFNDPECQQWLLPNVGCTDQAWQDRVSPPGRQYYDDSYVTCLVETQYLGTNSHLISEKTYDNLIQGRGVLNFATPGFYRQLTADGWQLPNFIDWSWNDIVDDRQRLDAYLGEIDRLFSCSMSDLHDWYMSNWACWQHNQRMLETKPYDIIDFSSIT